jgi:hypothetical protein
MTGPFFSMGAEVFDGEGDLIAKAFRSRDAERIAADLNLADSVIAGLVQRGGAKVVRFNLDRIKPEDRIDAVEHTFGESIERERGDR